MFSATTKKQYQINLLLIIFLITLVRIIFLATNGRSLAGDEAQYWSWSQHLAWGYYSKPPMIAWVIRLFTDILGNSEFAIRLASPLIHALTTWFIFLIGQRLFDEKIAYWSGLVYLLMPGVSFSAAIMSTDVFLLFFWAFAFYFFVLALEKNSIYAWLFCGLGIGLALLSKFTAFIFILSALIYLLFSQQERRLLRTKGPYIALGVALIVFLPNLIWNLQHHFISAHHVVNENIAIKGAHFHLGNMLEFIGAQFGIFNPILFYVLLQLLFKWSYTKQLDKNQKLLLSFVVPLLSIIVIESLLSRAYANWAAAIYITASVAVAAYLIKQNKIKWLKISLIINIIFAVLFYSYEPIAKALGIKFSSHTFFNSDVLGWDKVGQEVSAIHAQYPNTLILSNDRMLLAELLYYAKVPMNQAFSWNLKPLPSDHYNLVNDINQKMGQDFIFVTYDDKPEAVFSYFKNAQLVQHITVPILTDEERHLYVFLLKGFNGLQYPYPPKGP